MEVFMGPLDQNTAGQVLFSLVTANVPAISPWVGTCYWYYSLLLGIPNHILVLFRFH